MQGKHDGRKALIRNYKSCLPRQASQICWYKTDAEICWLDPALQEDPLARPFLEGIACLHFLDVSRLMAVSISGECCVTNLSDKQTNSWKVASQLEALALLYGSF